MAELKIVQILPPYNGMNSMAAPGKCPEGTAPLVRNFLTHVPGKLSMRGPISQFPYGSLDVFETTTYEPLLLTGVWSFDDQFVTGTFEKGSVTEKFMPPWASLYLRATESKHLGRGHSRVRFGNFKTNAWTNIQNADSGAGSGTPMGKGVRMEDYLYGWEYASRYETAENIQEVNGGKYGMRHLLRWDGQNGSPPRRMSNAPEGGQDIIAHLNRIWVLGGNKVDKTKKEKLAGKLHTVIGEGGQGPTALQASSAADIASIQHIRKGDKLTNTGATKLPAGTEATSDPKLQQVGAAVEWYVLTNKTVWGAEEVKEYEGIEVEHTTLPPYEPNSLRYTDQGGPIGDSTSYWVDDVSGLENNIIVGDDDKNDFGVGLGVVGKTLIIFKRHSIWALYGYSPTTFQLQNLTQERGCVDQASITEINNGLVFASQNGIEFFNGSEFKQLDDQIENITRPLISTIAGDEGQRASIKSISGRISTTYIGNDYVLVVFGYQNSTTGGQPTSAFPTWAGYVHLPTGNWSEFSWKAGFGESIPVLCGTSSDIPWIYDGRELHTIENITSPGTSFGLGLNQVDQTRAETSKGIPAKYITDRIAMASPGYTNQGHRFLFDYKFPNGINDSAAAAGWFVTLFGGSNEELVPEQQVPGMGLNSTNFFNGRRFEKDFFTESTDSRLVVEWKSEKTTNVRGAEAFDGALEIQVARQRRST